MSALGSKWKKLTPADVAEIRLRVDAGGNRSALAREYGVRPQTVDYHVAQGKRLADPYAAALEAACAARRRGDKAGAAEQLRQAADAVEGNVFGIRLVVDSAMPPGLAAVVGDFYRAEPGAKVRTFPST